ncbi:MAG: transposase [Oligoflexales bacterium]|nr:transposase [Oligoflexales bacterium]
MLMGIKLQARPTETQKSVLSQWMGCARFVWNAKCDEDKYLSSFARKFLPIGTYAPIDQKFAQYKNKELSPWLYDCPSQILRNSAVGWYQTYQKFLRGECGKPKHKKKCDGGSVHLTSELFSFVKCEDGVSRLFIGSKTNNIGFLAIKNHTSYNVPNSIHIKKKNGEYSVSFCYEDELDESNLNNQKDSLDYLKDASKEYLEKYAVGIDRGVIRPIQAGNDIFDLTPEQKRNKIAKEKYLNRYQRRLSKQKKGSKRRGKTKRKVALCHKKIANIRKDFCHKASHSIVSKKDNKIIILEDLQTKNMTRRPKAKKNEMGHWEKNQAKAKAGLNKSILDKGWHQLESYIKYKSYRAGKVWFKIPALYTSQECAACGHTHPDNRMSQSVFSCVSCGHTDNADHNAAEVIKKRAIKLILDSGTELSKRGVLLDTGRGAINKTKRAKASSAYGNEASKKKRKVA